MKVVIKKMAVLALVIGLILIMYTAGIDEYSVANHLQHDLETKMLVAGIVLMLPFPIIQGMWG